MLCSVCSNPVRPVVALDIDGTLGDYHTHFLQFACNYLGIIQHPRYFEYQGERGFGEWFGKAFGVDLTTFRQVKLAYRQGGMKRSMPPFRSATKLVNEVRNAGAEVWLTTTRPYLRLDNVDPDTRFWLSQCGIKYDGMLYDEDKYTLLAEHVDRERVVAVLDDLIEQCHAAANVFGSDVPIHRMSRYNVHGGWNHNNVTTLDEASDVITERIKQWEVAHVAA